ncbi:MAG TPA: methyltransferase domain-containing protein [Edaphocola sp.]|nr:methyltransferase domain-containing protein [Edaphocola sp.]
MKKFWDERYIQEGFAYGESPNEYLQSKLGNLAPGKVLFPGDGEGRNSVYAAKLGWTVDAFDISKEGKKKAEQFALRNQVSIDYQLASVESINYPDSYFDAMALVFIHFQEEERAKYHRILSSKLKKGGILILEAFSKTQIQMQQRNPQSGGPQTEKMLYCLDSLKSDFEDFTFLEAYETVSHLNEGCYHIGDAALVRIVAIKK